MAKKDDDLLLENEIDETFFGGDEELTNTPAKAVTSSGTTFASSDDDIDDVPGQLAVDVYETQEKLVIKSRVAGVNANDLDINIADGVLTINGALSASEDAAATQWHIQECYWGDFSRTISLPVPVIEDEVEAVLRDGVLTISFVKVQPAKQKISVVKK
ncbi:MAG: Hsp20/alpha crystallin family protein [Candidatus Nomurabacteria bacterium]|jgi:HSP20 family protein|nr:Hsp20/alpha crystallin family protein [Candidatus Nomurabacteria bacterium]